jgi:hypothetical protein
MREGDCGRPERRRTPLMLRYYSCSRSLRMSIRFGFLDLPRSEVAVVAARMALGQRP